MEIMDTVFLVWHVREVKGDANGHESRTAETKLGFRRVQISPKR